jgi:hypothetical protein
MLTIQRAKPLALHVLLPGVAERADQWTRDYGGLPQVAALEVIFSKGNQQTLPVRGFDATLCWLFGLSSAANRDLPLGALRRLGFNSPQDSGFWVCADPVSLRADVAHVFLTDSESLNITPREAQRLAGLLRLHFTGQGWILEIGSPACWHLRLSSAELIQTYPQRAVMGKPIEGYLPSGAHASRWRGLLNEIQMLFHGADVNLERKQRVAPSINGLWISGAGKLPSSAELRKGADVMWSGDPVAIGLSRLTDTPLNSVPQSFATIMTNNPCGVHLVSLQSLLAPASYDDFGTWRERLDLLESTWFAPILQATSAGKLAECHIYDCAGRRFSFTRADRWRLWRGIKPLHACLDNLQ